MIKILTLKLVGLALLYSFALELNHGELNADFILTLALLYCGFKAMTYFYIFTNSLNFKLFKI